ncbi:unnamed protein product [Penicillium bialowiezense]
MKGFVGGIPIALLAVAAQAQFVERRENGIAPPQVGGTALGGPTGEDSDGGFVSPYSADIKTNHQVKQWSKDDHSVNIKHTDEFPDRHTPVVFDGPQVPGMGPFGKRGGPGGTALGGPSGNDGGQEFNMPLTAIIHTDVNDFNQDDHSIEEENTHVHPGWGYAKRWHPEEGGTALGGPGGGSHHGAEGSAFPNGGTALGGPSGDDDGITFSKPNTANINTNVNEVNKDDHSIDLKHKDVYNGWGWKRGYGPEHANGGTALGGPSGDDEGQSFNMPTTVDVNTNVNEHNQDDHSIDLKHKDVYNGWGWKRGYGPDHANGGTALGGPSGDDEGQSFNMPTTVDVNTNVNEQNQDSHAIDLKHKDIHGGPHWGGPGPAGPHYGPHPGVYAPHVYAPHADTDLNSIKQLNNGPAAGGVGPFNRRSEEFWGPRPGVYAPHVYAPEDDFDLNTISQVNNGPAAGGVGPFNVHRRSTDLPEHFPPHAEHPHPHGPPSAWAPGVYAPHVYAPEEDFDLNAIKQINNGPAAGGVGPFNVHRRSTDLPEHFPPHAEHPHPHGPPGAWAPGVYAPHVYAPHEDFDLDAISQVNNGPSAGGVGPFGRRAFAPSRESNGGGGTALGGPSGDDDAASFSEPTNVDVNTGVDSNNEDNHAIKSDVTHVHHPDGDYGYEAVPAPAQAPAPPAEEWSEGSPSVSPQEGATPPRQEEGACSAQVHEVVRTVTKTQYKTAMATHMQYESAPAMQTSAVPMAMTPQQSAEVDPKIMSWAASASAPASSEVRNFDYSNQSQRPNSKMTSYSMIPVHVPMATPASSGAMVTPSGTHGLNMPTGVSAEQKAASSAAWASASPSASHGPNDTLFMGAAPRLSGGLVSAATAVMGVLAFIL